MRRGLILVVCLLGVATAREATAYDSDFTHRWITRQAVEYLARAFPGKYDEVLAMIESVVDGSHHEDDLFFDGDEDAGTVRLMRHFYRPTDQAGLTMDVFGTFINSYQWGAQPHAGNEWGYDDAIAAYRAGDPEEAYFALGHVVHLIQDLTVPAHTHLDVHGPPAGDDYEQYCTSMMISDRESMLAVPADGTPIPAASNLRELWDLTANASYWRNMYPGDLSDRDAPSGIIAEMFPTLGWSWLQSNWTIDGIGGLDSGFFEHQPGYYYFKKANESPLIDKHEYDALDPLSHDYAGNEAELLLTERLAADLVPVAILHSAAVIKMFADEVEGTAPEPEPEPTDSGGCSSSGSAPASAAVLIVLAIGLWSRRRWLLVAGVVAATSAPAAAHDVRARLSASALDYLEAEVVSYFDESRFLPAFTGELSCVEIEQRDTELDLDIRSVDVSIPEPGVIRLDADFSAVASGELFLDNLYLCIGNTTCQDTITVSDAHATVEIASVTVDGRPTAVVRSFELTADEQDVVLEFSGCALADEANDLLDFLPSFARQVMLDFLGQFLSTRAEAALGGVIDDVLGVDGIFHGYLGFAEMNADLYELEIDRGGIELGASMDITSPFPPNSCVYDGVFDEPEDAEGRPPALSTETHLAMAFNVGMINDALYHVWRAGFLCLTEGHFAALGAAIDFDLITGMVPGFPPGTEVSLELTLDAPPRLRGASNDNLAVTLDVVGAKVALRGELPNGTVSTVSIGVDAAATGVVSLDPATSTLSVRATDFDIEYLSIAGYDADVGELSFDAGRIQSVLEDFALPELFDQIGDYPLTGAVTNLSDYALILRDISTTEAYMTLAADLFRVPAGDTAAPDSSIESSPQGLVSVRDARLIVSGHDAEIPRELLRYAVTVDGVDQAISAAREIRVGTPGVSATYDVTIAAVDLADNVDPTPARAEIRVDGRPPRLAVLGEHVRKSRETDHAIEWTATDDIATDDELTARLEVFRLEDPTEPLSGVSTDTVEVPAGTRVATVHIEPGAIYRVDVVAIDTVGNEGRSSMFIDARSSSGGCSTTGTDTGPLWLLAVVAVLWSRTRATPRPAPGGGN